MSRAAWRRRLLRGGAVGGSRCGALLLLPVLLLAFSLAGSCRQTAKQEEEAPSVSSAAARIPVFVSIPPQKYFVERVGGERVEVEVLVGPGQSPVTYSPPPRQLTRLGEAAVYFRIGVPFERQLSDKITAVFKSLRVVDTHQGIEKRPLGAAHRHDDGRGRSQHREGEHRGQVGDAAEMDPHVWLDPRLVKSQALIICRTLCLIDPAHAEEYEANLASFEKDLDDVHRRITQALAPLKGREFFVFHAAYGYFGEAYGLKQVAVETGGKGPSPKQLAALIDRAKAAGVRLIFVQPQFSRDSAETLARSIGGAVVGMDPLAEDYLSNLWDMAAKISESLHGGEVADEAEGLARVSKVPR